MITPKIAATITPIKSASRNRTIEFSITSLIHFEKNALENAPTHINPAWPRLSSPRIPTTRFRETARIIYVQSGTRSPVKRLEILPVLLKVCITTKATITIA